MLPPPPCPPTPRYLRDRVGNVRLQNKVLLVVLFCNSCGMLTALLIGGRYFERLCDVYLYVTLVAKSKT